MSPPNELVLCSGTLMQRGLRALSEAATAGGFAGITLWPRDVEIARAEGLSWSDQRALLADAGLAVRDLDPLLAWLPGETPPPGVGGSEREFYEMAEALGARSLNVAQGFGSTIDPEVAAEALAGVCDRAREHGLLVTLEYLPWSGIPDAASALAVVERCGRDNASIMIDTWHSFRGPTDAAQLAALPAARVGSIQISDAPAEPAADLVQETTEARLLPGEGVVPIALWLRDLFGRGVDAPVGVEVFSASLRALEPAEIGRRCGEAARRVLAAL